MTATDNLTKKTDFYLDTLEAFIDFEELKQIIVKAAKDTANKLEMFPQGASDFEKMYKDEDYWIVLIANICCRWALRHNIGPNLFIETMTQATTFHYAADIARRVLEQTSEPLKSTAEDLDDISNC